MIGITNSIYDAEYAQDNPKFSNRMIISGISAIIGEILPRFYEKINVK